MAQGCSSECYSSDWFFGLVVQAEARLMLPSNVEVNGFCLPRFERVREAFQRNFLEQEEIGADFALIVRGETVAELRGGWRDAARSMPWKKDTIANVWSTSKGVAAVCFAMLVDRGIASYDDKVSRYWPEFGVAGKSGVTIGMLLSHQGGLSGFITPATLEGVLAG